MVNQLKWLDRKFEFNLPAGVFPDLLERMIGTPARLDDMAKSLSNEVLEHKPGGEWSVKEQIGHLIDLESFHETRLDEILAGKEVLTPVDMNNKTTNEANHNASSIADLLGRFRKVRTDFVMRMEKLDEETIQRSGLHPRLKIPMRIIDIAYFTSEHDDHHLAKIRQIINSQSGKPIIDINEFNG